MQAGALNAPAGENWPRAEKEEKMIQLAGWVRILIVTGILTAMGLTGMPCSDASARQASAADERTVDEIVAVVGNTPILRSEIDQQAQILAEYSRVDPADSTTYGRIYREVLESQINEQLLVLEAESQGMDVTPADIERQVDAAVQGNIRALGGRAGFEEQLRLEGLTESELREQYRDEARKTILVNRLLQNEVRPKVVMTEEKARRFFEENRAMIPPKPRQLRLQSLFIRTRPDPVVEERARERAEEIHEGIVQGMSFQEAARRFSDDPRGSEGGVLGRFGRDDLDPEMAEVAFSLAIGDVSRPVSSGFGYHILKLIERDPDGDWVELRHILCAATPTRSDEVKAEDRATEIFSRIRSGEISLTDAILRYSEAPNAKETEGDLGWLPIDQVFGKMRAVVDTLRVGRLAGPVGGDGGYHIFRVLGEEAEGTFTYDEIADVIRHHATEAEMEKGLNSYLEELRKRHFVEVRVSW